MRLPLFAAYSVCLSAINVPVLRALTDFSRQNDTASHLILIPFVTLVLLYQRRDAIGASASDPARGSVLSAAVLLAASAGLVWSGAGPAAFLPLGVAAFVVLWVAGFVLFYGPKAFQLALFPLLFLGFMIPIPERLLAAATQFLKEGSTEAVEGLLALSGTPFYREGFVFSLPSVVIEVADECSGIRSSIALLLTSLLAGDMFLKSGWKKTALVIAIVPLAILKNAVRIVSLTLLAIHVDPSFLTGQLHHEGGIVFFLFTLAILGPILALLRRSEMDRPSEARTA